MNSLQIGEHYCKGSGKITEEMRFKGEFDLNVFGKAI